MTVEYDAAYIADLDPALPEDSDDISEGASHIRLIKQDLQNTFPNIAEAMTVSDAYLNDLDDALTFGNEDISDENSTQVYYASINNRRLKGGVEGREGTDFAILSQVQDMINQALSEGIFPVGSYYMTDSSDSPADILGFGTWNKVSGMLFGSGSFLSVDGSTQYAFNAGETGGTVDKLISSTNIPDLSVDLSKKDSNGTPLVSTVAVPDHVHKYQAYTDTDVQYYDHRMSIDDVHVGSRDQNTEGAGGFPDGIALRGVLHIGAAVGEQTPLNVMNPYVVTNVWKRTA